MKIYLDNGATTKVADEVFEAMKPYFSEKYGNASSVHSLGREAEEVLEKSREKLAEVLGCDASEIIFTSGGTESDNLAIRGVAKVSKGKHIITSKFEHPAVLKTCEALEKDDYEVSYIGIDKEGFVKIDEIEKAIRKDTVLVSIMHANNEIGTIQDIEKIGKICKKNNVLFHTDAVQSLGKVKLDLKNVDLASFSSHKLHGPKGVGALYIKKDVKIGSIMTGGGHEFNLRGGTENIAGIVGFVKACEMLSTGNIEKLRDKLIKGLEKIGGKLNGSKKNRLINNVNIIFEGIEGESMLYLLDDKDIFISTGSACTSKKLEPSYVLTALGLKPEKAHGSLRFTLSKYTTEEEIDHVLKVMPEIIKKLGAISTIK